MALAAMYFLNKNPHKITLNVILFVLYFQLFKISFDALVLQQFITSTKFPLVLKSFFMKRNSSWIFYFNNLYAIFSMQSLP